MAKSPPCYAQTPVRAVERRNVQERFSLSAPCYTWVFANVASSPSLTCYLLDGVDKSHLSNTLELLSDGNWTLSLFILHKSSSSLLAMNT